MSIIHLLSDKDDKAREAGFTACGNYGFVTRRPAEVTCKGCRRTVRWNKANARKTSPPDTRGPTVDMDNEL